MKIIAWVNKTDRKKLEKLTDNIHFATSLEDFEAHLDDGVMPLFSLGLAGRALTKTTNVIRNHLSLKFFFLD